MNNQIPTPNPTKPIEDMIGLTDDKVTLGKMVRSIIHLDGEIPSEGGSLIKMIQHTINDNNLPLDFITAPEQAKLAAFDIKGIDPLAPPIELAEMNKLAGEFDTLNKALKIGDPTDPMNNGLIQDFIDMDREVSNNSAAINALENSPILSPNNYQFTKEEKSRLSVLGNKLLDQFNDFDIDIDFVTDLTPKLRSVGFGTGGSIFPADQAKIDHISVTKDIDLDGVGAALLDGNKTLIKIWAKTNLITVTNAIDLDAIPKTGAEIKTAYEAEADTNAFDDLAKIKSGYVSVTPLKYQIAKDQTWIGSGLGNVDLHLDNKVGENGTLSGQGSTAEWFIGAFPKSTTHADDFVIANVANGGIVLDVKTDSKVRIKDTNGYKTVATVQDSDTSSRPITNLEVGQCVFDTTLGKPVWCKSVGPDVWVDATGATV